MDSKVAYLNFTSKLNDHFHFDLCIQNSIVMNLDGNFGTKIKYVKTDNLISYIVNVGSK